MEEDTPKMGMDRIVPDRGMAELSWCYPQQDCNRIGVLSHGTLGMYASTPVPRIHRSHIMAPNMEMP